MIGVSARERQEAEIFVFYLRSCGSDPRGACTVMALSCNIKFEMVDPRARSAGVTRGSAENNSRVMMA